MKHEIPIKKLLQAYTEQRENHTFLCTVINNMVFGKPGVMDCTAQVKRFFDKYFVEIPGITLSQHVSIPVWYFRYKVDDSFNSIQTADGEALDISKFRKSSDVRIFMLKYILSKNPNETFILEDFQQ